jgi:hypothetical protein
VVKLTVLPLTPTDENNGDHNKDSSWNSSRHHEYEITKNVEEKLERRDPGTQVSKQSDKERKCDGRSVPVEIIPDVPLGQSADPNRNVSSEKGENSRGTIHDPSRGGNIKQRREREEEDREIISYFKYNIIHYVYVHLYCLKYMER